MAKTGRFGLIATLMLLSTCASRACYAQEYGGGTWVGSGTYDVESLAVDQWGHEQVVSVQSGSGNGKFIFGYTAYPGSGATGSGFLELGQGSSAASFDVGFYPSIFSDVDPTGLIDVPIGFGSPPGPGTGQVETLVYTIDQYGNVTAELSYSLDQLVDGYVGTVFFSGTPYVAGVPEPSSIVQGATATLMIAGLAIGHRLSRRRRSKSADRVAA